MSKRNIVRYRNGSIEEKKQEWREMMKMKDERLKEHQQIFCAQ